MVKQAGFAGAMLAALLIVPAAAGDTPPPSATEIVPPEVLSRHDYALADTPNKRTALAYLYTAWNDGQLAQARLTYWVRGSFPELERGGEPSGPPGARPKYTIKKVIEEGDHVVVLAFVEGVGIGTEITTVFGTPGGTKIGDAVVEIFQFDESGLIRRKWDTIEPVSEKTYDFK